MRGSPAGPPHLVRAEDLHRFVTVDLAVSTRTSADFTVIAVWGVHDLARANAVRELGVDAIILDELDLIATLRATR